MTTSTLDAADEFVAGLGRPRLVHLPRAKGQASVYELEVPEGMASPVILSIPNVSGVAEVYNRDQGDWRSLPTGRLVDAPLERGELARGLVRVRLPDPEQHLIQLRAQRHEGGG